MFKYLAALFMVIDHIAYIFEPLLPHPAVLVMRSIGRLAFPMFAYALARGYNRTRNIFYYFLRLSFFAVITQILFTVLTRHFNLTQFLFQNVLITFVLAFGLMVGIDLIERSSMDLMVMMRPVLSEGEVNKRFSPGGIRLPSWLGTVTGILLIIASLWLCFVISPDYGLYGLLTVLIFQRTDRSEPSYERSMRKDLKRRRFLKYFLYDLLLNLLFVYGNYRSYGNDFYTWIQLFSVPAVLLFPLYEISPKPSKFGKYFFYVFYPAHFCLLLVLRAHLIL